MSAEIVDSLIELLWPDGDGPDTRPVFALLDGARSRRIEPMLRFSKRQYRSLFSGVLEPRLAAAAPFVVYLARESQFTRDLIEASWGNHWGSFLIGDDGCTHEQIRRHFRRFLKVRDEDGRTYMFRFYDPRVTRAYVDACDRFEREAFFGPVLSFVLCGRTKQPVVLERTISKPGPAPAARRNAAAAR